MWLGVAGIYSGAAERGSPAVENKGLTCGAHMSVTRREEATRMEGAIQRGKCTLTRVSKRRPVGRVGSARGELDWLCWTQERIEMEI
jgi:hypothetical protein